MRTPIIASLSLFLCTCSTTVNLTVRNTEEKATLAPNVQTADKNGVKDQEILLGDVGPKGQAKTTIKMDKGGSFYVSASMPQSAVVFKSAPITVTGNPNPLESNVSMQIQSIIIDDSKSFTALSQSFKNLGADIGAQPLAVKDALETMIGALVVAEPQGGDKPGKILFSLPPNQFGVRSLRLEDVSYPPTNETQGVKIIGKSAINANANFALLAKFGFTFNSDDLYDLNWVMRGFGQVVKAEDPDKDCTSRFNALKNDIKTHIKDILKEHNSAKLYYINSFYVLEHAEMTVKTAKKTSIGADFNAATIVSGNSTYTFENSTDKNNGYGPVVLNYWGEELNLISVEAPTIKTFGPVGFVPTGGPSKSGKDKTVDLLVVTGNRIRFADN
jgi:hypothetical protein